MTMRISPAARAIGLALVLCLVDASQAAPVVYTLRTVSDGALGRHVFYQALVTIRMVADTRTVVSEPSAANPKRPVFKNAVGHATVTIDDAGRTLTASFDPGQIYVRYDTGAGVAGFGSAGISPNYPVALDCSNSGYPSDAAYTADCLQGDAWNLTNLLDGSAVYENGILAQLNAPSNPSLDVTGLPQSLSATTLLTGETHACAGTYTFAPDWWWGGDLWVCGGQAPEGLHTNRGDFFLQDQVGGSNNSWVYRGGWDLANTGFLNVEVLPDREAD